MNQATAAELLSMLARSPDAYPQRFDTVRRCVLVVGTDAAGYGAASFLDDRILTPATRGAWVPFDRVAAQARRLGEGVPVHYIFHTGHVGSTLLSRLLDATGVVLGLREPLPLRALADAHDALGSPSSLMSRGEFALAVETFVRLWSRAYAGTRCVVVKATSAAARVAPELLRRRASSRAVCLNVRAETSLATLLAGANSLVDLRGHGPERMRRLSAWTPAKLEPLHAMSVGEMAALAWATETLTQSQVRETFPERVLPVDFDALLEDLGGRLRSVLEHFSLPCDDDTVARLEAHPSLDQYSKAPEHAYGPGRRRELLEAARTQQGAEIARGLAWLERLAGADPRIAARLGTLR